MGISTNQQRIYFFAGYLRLAMFVLMNSTVPRHFSLVSGVGIWGPAINTSLALHVSPAVKTKTTSQSRLLAPPQLPVFRAPEAGAVTILGFQW